MSTSIIDPIAQGLARGWKVLGGNVAGQDRPMPSSMDCDVVIIGSGAGAGITAELLAKAGLKIIILEEGPLRSSSDFRQLESEAYSQLYQEAGGRKNSEQTMPILQGRCVGGSTTVNWAGAFRTPTSTLEFWGQKYGLGELNASALSPWFEQVERRLNVGEWMAAPNENNAVIQRGGLKIGVEVNKMHRNVKGCWNLGSCGLGCPTNAKQSMLVTTIPAALDLGATLLVQTRAERLELQGDQAQAVICQPIALNGDAAGPALRITAKHFVVAGGAINSPALLMRSGAPDPHKLLGKRTFLHPTAVSSAMLPEAVEGWAGAPMSVFSDQFLRQHPIDGPVGYKLETAPVHPGFALTNLGGMGSALGGRMKAFPHLHIGIALLRDGFHEQAPGGTVSLKSDGSASLSYVLNDYLLDGVRRAHLTMAEIQFAAGAKTVRPGHEQAEDYTSWEQAKSAIQGLNYQPFLTVVGSAHVMGGCGLASEAGHGVVRPDGQHWQLANVSVHDGSLFPTSIGANPQVTVYTLANRFASGLAKRLAGKDVLLA